MYKKTTSIFLITILMLTTIFSAHAVNTPTISVSSVSAEQGETIELHVLLQGNPGINTFAFGFSYDETQLKLLDVTVNKELGGQFVYKEKAVWFSGEDTTYNGNILTLQFKVLDSAVDGESVVSVTYSPGDISNYNEDDIGFNIKPGGVLIGDADDFLARLVAALVRIIECLRIIFRFF